MYLITVFYNPNEKQISNTIKICEYNNCIIIDNTPCQENRTLKNIFQKKESQTQIIYIPLRINKGIACAYNIGIGEAKKQGAKYVLFLDQDSVITHDFAALLLGEYKKLCLQNTNIAALGPSLINEYTGKLYKTEDYKSNVVGFSTTSTLISSGMLVEIQTLDNVGGMDESLFIDYVDFEWCWRANLKGYICYRTKNVTMNHKVGLGDKSIFKYTILTATPNRYYYQYRNLLKLCRRNYVPIKWKLKESLKMIFFLIYIPLVSKQTRFIWKSMIQGIKDGIR
jgi:rhamnosyltransferase